MKILGFSGAAAKTGAVAALLSESLQAAAEEIAELGEIPNTALIHLVDIVKDFHDGSFTNIPSSLQSTFDSMRTADGFVFRDARPLVQHECPYEMLHRLANFA